MSEEKMEEVIQEALKERGIDDEIIAAGQFEPRGTTGAIFAGGMVGSEVGDLAGGVGEAVGLVGGSIAGAHVAADESGLPRHMLVGVSDSTVYGFAMRSRSKPPGDMVFRVPRAGLTVKVHQRVNVRVLELIDEANDSHIELEGSRIPVTHSKDVIEVLG
jgi:hypothetical protein